MKFVKKRKEKVSISRNIVSFYQVHVGYEIEKKGNEVDGEKTDRWRI